MEISSRFVGTPLRILEVAVTARQTKGGRPLPETRPAYEIEDHVAALKESLNDLKPKLFLTLSGEGGKKRVYGRCSRSKGSDRLS